LEEENLTEKYEKAREVKKTRKDLSPEELEQRKERLLAQGTPSVTASIADAVVLKNKRVYFLTKPDGSIPQGNNHGYGLYYGDCRYLNTYQMKIFDSDLNVLVSNSGKGFRGVYELTNNEIMIEAGKHLRRDEIGITWERVIEEENPTLHDLLTIKNYELEDVDIRLSITFNSQFEAVFAIRGLLPIQPGELLPAKWEDGAIHFAYAGADDIYRHLGVHFSRQPDENDECTVHFDFHLRPMQSEKLAISLIITNGKDAEEVKQKERKQPEISQIQEMLKKPPVDWKSLGTDISSNSLLLNNLIDRSMLDLFMMKDELNGKRYFGAGVPWFVTLFGRDSIIIAMQLLMFDPDISAETLQLLASFQGEEENEWRDEQPGKILHELREGELATIGEIPHTPYYGTVDATMLFLVLIARHAAWTGDLSLFRELKGNIDRALEWIDKYGDLNQDGYIEYESLSGSGLVNQGWKDTGDAVLNADGSLAVPPIALVEVQAYIYMAKTTIADLFERDGDKDRAEQLIQEAEELKERFNQDFWNDELGTYILGFQKDRKPVAVVTSNPGHALWAGIADKEKGEKTAQRLMKADMFSGYGIRTLSDKEFPYNPIGYHLGTVWPHDNGIIAAGFRKYGFNDYAQQIFNGLKEAALGFDDYRLPELFGGFPKDQYQVPVSFPIACHPQSWAAGSIIFMLESYLGLKPEAFDNRLLIEKPMLPDFIDRLTLRKLRVGQAQVDLKFVRKENETIEVEVLSVEGELEVIIR
jgi:glycogen debranching enzyme